MRDDNSQWQFEQQQEQEFKEMERALQLSGVSTEKEQASWDLLQKTAEAEISNVYHQVAM